MFYYVDTGMVYSSLVRMKRRFTEDAWRKEPWFRSLVSALRTAARSDAPFEDVLRDLSTLSEMQALSERLEIARLIGKGWSYRQVAKETGASTATVTRIAHVLENGTGGLRNLLKIHRHHRLLPKPSVSAEQTPMEEPVAEEPPAPLPQVPPHLSPLQKYLDRR